MHAVAFDTHEFIKTLEESGFKEEQAEALSKVIKQVQEANLEELATKKDILELKHGIKELEVNTKSDIKKLEASTKSAIKELEANTKFDIKELEASTKCSIADVKRDIALAKADIFKWGVGILFLQAGLIVTVIRLMK